MTKSIKKNLITTIVIIIIICLFYKYNIIIKETILCLFTTKEGQIDKITMWTAIGSIATLSAVIVSFHVLYKTLEAQNEENKFNNEMLEHKEIVKEFKDVLKHVEPGMIFKSLKYLDTNVNKCYDELIDYINSSSRLGYRIALTIPTKEYNEIILKKENWTIFLNELIKIEKEKIDEIITKINELNYGKKYFENKRNLVGLKELNNEIINSVNSGNKEECEELLKKNKKNINILNKNIKELKKYSDIDKINSEIEDIKIELGKVTDVMYNRFYEEVKQYLEIRNNNILKKYTK